MDDGLGRVSYLPSNDKLERLLAMLLEVATDNKQRLVRMETRMCRLMAAQGLDREGNKIK